MQFTAFSVLNFDFFFARNIILFLSMSGKFYLLAKMFSLNVDTRRGGFNIDIYTPHFLWTDPIVYSHKNNTKNNMTSQKKKKEEKKEKENSATDFFQSSVFVQRLESILFHNCYWLSQR